AGDLDPSFSGDGKLITGFGAQAEDVAIQPDGKIVAAGLHFGSQSRDFALARYNPDGTPDTGFGNDGTVTTDFAGNNDDLFAIALQP
ncbi:delta-60 repeat domain-containing protein, partial [Vibrio parahaemolyticus]|uniref:delta-60 repeat domain-containing protein n=1 Tax=Vibrio parahaemolyticus TaxID=670 RepID=UPI001A900B64